MSIRKFLWPLIFILFISYCHAQTDTIPQKDSNNNTVSLFSKFKIHSDIDFSETHFNAFYINNGLRKGNYVRLSNNNFRNSSYYWDHQMPVPNNYSVYQVNTINSIDWDGKPGSWNHNAWGNPPNTWYGNAWGEGVASLLYGLAKYK